jgi:hypothetical protein
MRSNGPCPVNEERAQIDVAAFAYSKKPFARSACVLAWNQTKPGSQLATASKCVRIRYAGDPLHLP